jgi:hypothetical protein
MVELLRRSVNPKAGNEIFIDFNETGLIFDKNIKAEIKVGQPYKVKRNDSMIYIFRRGEGFCDFEMKIRNELFKISLSYEFLANREQAVEVELEHISNCFNYREIIKKEIGRNIKDQKNKFHFVEDEDFFSKIVGDVASPKNLNDENLLKDGVRQRLRNCGIRLSNFSMEIIKKEYDHIPSPHLRLENGDLIIVDSVSPIIIGSAPNSITLKKYFKEEGHIENLDICKFIVIESDIVSAIGMIEKGFENTILIKDWATFATPEITIRVKRNFAGGERDLLVSDDFILIHGDEVIISNSQIGLKSKLNYFNESGI